MDYLIKFDKFNKTSSTGSFTTTFKVQCGLSPRTKSSGEFAEFLVKLFNKTKQIFNLPTVNYITLLISQIEGSKSTKANKRPLSMIAEKSLIMSMLSSHILCYVITQLSLMDSYVSQNDGAPRVVYVGKVIISKSFNCSIC